VIPRARTASLGRRSGSCTSSRRTNSVRSVIFSAPIDLLSVASCRHRHSDESECVLALQAGQTWTVTFAGEGGTDAGGLFRDSVSHICNDLQSAHVPLFLPCPNAKAAFGYNQEKFVPNPACTSSLHLSMFAFVGKLMGIAVRGRHILNLDFPDFLWRQLVGAPVGRRELQDIDGLFYMALDRLATCQDDPTITPATFSSVFADLCFTVKTLDGREVELVAGASVAVAVRWPLEAVRERVVCEACGCTGGQNVAVTWENRREYCALAEKYRLQEVRAQVEAIRSGLGTIIPLQVLSLFTSQELELNVCGTKDINLDLLLVRPARTQ
jgi:hypothetical protein